LLVDARFHGRIGMGKKSLIESVHDFILEFLDKFENIKFVSLFGIIVCIILITISFGGFKDMV